MEAPQNRRFYGKMKCLSLWPTYIGEKGRTLGKTYGIKAKCYWEHPWGTHWELERNMLGTKEKWKKAPPPPPSNFKKINALWVHAEPSHWLHEFFLIQNGSSPITNWGYLWWPLKYNIFHKCTWSTAFGFSLDGTFSTMANIKKLQPFSYYWKTTHHMSWVDSI